MACDKTMLSHSQEGLLYGALIDYAGVNVSSLIKHQILIKILCCGYIVRFKQAISFFQSMERAVKNQLASSYLYHATPPQNPSVSAPYYICRGDCKPSLLFVLFLC